MLEPHREQARSHRDLCTPQIQCGSELARDSNRPDTNHLSQKQKRQPLWAAVFLLLTYPSSQTRKHYLRFSLLTCITLGYDFIEDVPRAVVVAHVDVGLGQIELGGDFVSAGEEVELRLVSHGSSGVFCGEGGFIHVMGQTIHLSVDVIQFCRERIRRLRGVHFVSQGQVEISRQFQIVQRRLGHGWHFNARQVFYTLIQVQQEVVIGQGRWRGIATEVQVEIEVRQVVEVVLDVRLLLQHRPKAQVVVQREFVQLCQRFGLRCCCRSRSNHRRRNVFQVIQAQVESAVEIIDSRLWSRRFRLVQQQVLDVLSVQLGSDGGGSNATGNHEGHGREAAFQLFDLGEVIAIGHQLALLGHERITITLLTIDFHQLQTQITALRFLLDTVFKQSRCLIQTTGGDVRLGVSQYVVVALGGRRNQGGGNRRRDHDGSNHWSRSWHRCRSWHISELHGRRRHFKTFEAAFRQVLLGGKLLFLRQGTRHAQMLFGFLLGFAATGQQQQQQQQNDCTTTHQPQQDRIGQQVIEGLIARSHRLRLDRRFGRGRSRLGRRYDRRWRCCSRRSRSCPRRGRQLSRHRRSSGSGSRRSHRSTRSPVS